MANKPVLKPEDRIKDLETQVDTLIAERARLAADHKTLTAEHDILKQANQALIARQAELEAELDAVRVQRPVLSFNQLGTQLKEALTGIQAAPGPEGAGLEYAVRNAQFEIKALVDVDDQGQPVLKFPIAGEPIEAGRLTTVNLVFDALARPEVDLGGLKLVPSLLGLTAEGAAQRLQRSGLALGAVAERESVAAPDSVVAQDPEGGAYLAEDTPVDIWLAIPARIEVPSVIGETLPEARQRLEAASLRAGEVTIQESDQPAGTILSQQPEAGTRVDAQSTVDLVVAARRPRTRTPDLIGMTLDDAHEALAGAKLKAGTVREQRSDQPAGTVIRQNPGPRTEVVPGTEVEMVVARKGIERTVPTPDLVGMTRNAALKKLEGEGWSYSLVAARVKDAAALRAEGRYDTVLAQSPEPGEPTLLSRKAVRLEILASPEGVGEVHGIGTKTSSRLARAGIRTVGDLLYSDPELVGRAARVSLDRARAFQDDARDLNDTFHLAGVEGLTREQATFLVKGAQVRTPDELAKRGAASLVRRLRAASQEDLPLAARGLRVTQPLVANWIAAARELVRRQ